MNSVVLCCTPNSISISDASTKCNPAVSISTLVVQPTHRQHLSAQQHATAFQNSKFNNSRMGEYGCPLKATRFQKSEEKVDTFL
jgi:hypothetical protein